MHDEAEMIREIDAEKIRRTRGMTPGQRIAASLEMSELCLDIMMGAERNRNPGASPGEVLQAVRRRLARIRDERPNP